MSLITKMLEFFNMDNWRAKQDIRYVSHVTDEECYNADTQNIEPMPIIKNQLEIEADFPYIPFIKHCAAGYVPGAYVFPNMTEQNQILYYIDSFNSSLFDLGIEYDIDDFHIYTETISFGYRNNNISCPKTFIDFTPYTKSGKKSKFPVSIVFTNEEEIPYPFDYDTLEYECGRISFLQDGNIGKANISIMRKGRKYYSVKYKLFGITLRPCMLKCVSVKDSIETICFKD